VNEESVSGELSHAPTLVSRAKAKGYKWLAYQWNDGTWGQQQRNAAPAYRQECANQGLIFTIWLTRPFQADYARQAAIESGCQGILLEGEVPSESVNPDTGQVEPRPEAVNWASVVLFLQDLDIAKGVVTNFAPFVHADGTLWPEKARPLVQAGYACVTENFISESPNSTPANTDFVARQLGWARTQPMIEGWRIPEYGDLSGYANVSHWDAGNVL
jgi:hypothetical protein